MIRDSDNTKLLYDMYQRALRDGNTVKEALAKMHDDAGVSWVGERQSNIIPDKMGNSGFWKIIDCEKFVMWKMKHGGSMEAAP